MEQTTLQGAQHRRKVGSQDEAKKSETILRHRNIQMKHLVFEIVKVVLETLKNHKSEGTCLISDYSKKIP